MSASCLLKAVVVACASDLAVVLRQVYCVDNNAIAVGYVYWLLSLAFRSSSYTSYVVGPGDGNYTYKHLDISKRQN